MLHDIALTDSGRLHLATYQNITVKSRSSTPSSGLKTLTLGE